MPGRASAARTTVQKHHRQTRGHAALLKVNLMPITHVQQPTGVGFKRWKEVVGARGVKHGRMLAAIARPTGRVMSKQAD